jgi:hypothetical protein
MHNTEDLGPFQEGIVNQLRLNCAALLALAASSLTLIACGESYSPLHDKISTTRGSRLYEQSAPSSTALTITDPAGNPVNGARVLIGLRENAPFPGNLQTTDANGQVKKPSAWNDRQPITVDADGYVRVTYFGRSPSDGTTLVMKHAITPKRLEFTGETQGFGTLTKDGFLDAGLVFPMITRSQLASVQVANLISQETDTISVFGQHLEVPSNVTLPKQTETYVLPITLNKPKFRTYVGEEGTHTFVATHARFPFREMVDASRNGKSLFDLINRFEFRQAGFVDATLTTESTKGDIPVNQVTFSPKLPITAPSYSAPYTMLALVLPEKDAKYFVSDIKNVASGATMTLRAPEQMGQGLLVSVLKDMSGDGGSTVGAAAESMSISIAPTNQSQAIDFLKTPKAPEVRATSLVLDPPASVNGVNASLTYAVLNKIDLIDVGQIKLEKKSAQWELYSESWAQALDLPELPVVGPQPRGAFRWEVTFAGEKSANAPVALGPAALEKASHVTRSAVDL